MNARSSERRTSDRNSSSAACAPAETAAAARVVGREVAEEEGEACPTRESSDPSESSEEVMDPGSERSRSEWLSPRAEGMS